jgi:AI-2 transport system permease protein
LKIPAYWNDAISGLLLLIIVVGDSKFQKYLIKQTTRSERKGKFINQKIFQKGDTEHDTPNKTAT